MAELLKSDREARTGFHWRVRNGGGDHCSLELAADFVFVTSGRNQHIDLLPSFTAFHWFLPR